MRMLVCNRKTAKNRYKVHIGRGVCLPRWLSGQCHLAAYSVQWTSTWSRAAYSGHILGLVPINHFISKGHKKNNIKHSKFLKKGGGSDEV